MRNSVRRHVGILLAAALAGGCGPSGGNRGSSSAASTAIAASTSSVPTPVAPATTTPTTTAPAATNAPIAGTINATPPTITSNAPAGTATPGLPSATPVVVTNPPVAPTPAPTPPPANAAKPGEFRRAVLCLDGLSYRIMAELQTRGYFRDFKPASRMVGTFPSLSNVGWAGLLDLGPENGYQAFYFSNELNKGVGSTKAEMHGTRYEKRMHHRIEGQISHGLSYVAPFLAGRAHLRKLIRGLEDHKGTETAFAYSLETDSVSHMRGRDYLIDLLTDMDNEIKQLQSKYRAKHGRDLEIVIISDHGHTLTAGKIVELEKWIKAGGYNATSEVKGPKDVAFRLAGILSSVAIHCQEQTAPDLGRLIARMDGADVCTFKSAAGFHVASSGGEAVFTHDAARDAYAYNAQTGDPLGYKAVFARLAASGKVDAKGFALQKDLFDATIDHAFPNALARIRQGHTDLVRSPAQVLVSLKPGFEAGMGIVKLAASLVGRNGTHGALSGNDTLGVYMTNFKATPAAINPEDFRKEIDLKDYKANAPSVEADVVPRFDLKGNRIGGEMRVLVRDDKFAASKARGETTTVKVVVKLDRWFPLSNKTVIGPVTADAATITQEGPSHVVKLPGGASVLEEGKDYRVEIKLERKDKNGTVVSKEDRELEFEYTGTYQQSSD